MYVEDLVLTIHTKMQSTLRNDPWQQDFLHSISDHIKQQKSLSTNQSHVILQMIAKFRHYIVRHGLATDDDLDNMLCHPQFYRPLYESVNVRREVRYLGDNLLGLRFKQHTPIVDRIKAIIPYPDNRMLNLAKATFDWEYRIWIVPVTRHTITRILTLLNEYQFHIDETTSTYLHLANRSRDQPSTITLASDDVLLANVCDNPLLAAWITEVAGGITV
jgi:hypothetical protein